MVHIYQPNTREKKISHSLIPDEGEFRGSGVRVEALNKAKK